VLAVLVSVITISGEIDSHTIVGGTRLSTLANGVLAFTASPFAVALQPSDLMITYGVIYVVGFFLFAMWSFSRRDL
jgi:hypothetical protein